MNSEELHSDQNPIEDQIRYLDGILSSPSPQQTMDERQAEEPPSIRPIPQPDSAILGSRLAAAGSSNIYATAATGTWTVTTSTSAAGYSYDTVTGQREFYSPNTFEYRSYQVKEPEFSLPNKPEYRFFREMKLNKKNEQNP